MADGVVGEEEEEEQEEEEGKTLRSVTSRSDLTKYNWGPMGRGG